MPSEVYASSHFETHQSGYVKSTASLRFTIVVPAFVSLEIGPHPVPASLEVRQSFLEVSETVRGRGNSGDIVLAVFQRLDLPLNSQSDSETVQAAKPLGYVFVVP